MPPHAAGPHCPSLVRSTGMPAHRSFSGRRSPRLPQAGVRRPQHTECSVPPSGGLTVQQSWSFAHGSVGALQHRAREVSQEECTAGEYVQQSVAALQNPPPPVQQLPLTQASQALAHTPPESEPSARPCTNVRPGYGETGADDTRCGFSLAMILPSLASTLPGAAGHGAPCRAATVHNGVPSGRGPPLLRHAYSQPTPGAGSRGQAPSGIPCRSVQCRRQTFARQCSPGAQG